MFVHSESNQIARLVPLHFFIRSDQITTEENYFLELTFTTRNKKFRYTRTCMFWTLVEKEEKYKACQQQAIRRGRWPNANLCSHIIHANFCRQKFCSDRANMVIIFERCDDRWSETNVLTLDWSRGGKKVVHLFSPFRPAHSFL